ncbi:TolC family outer membrane protein [Maritimibacter fusiformis]|uniref:TolC family outer membrane protein n=1 Tax=Maritimibacter fusiformis TaxID=2603819 RepID=A0A5D0RHM7_9RHOB|nr:TolC family outer membrane protein [Maritimibacter fusiformis]TYB81042.1 TolC family outer membrane protein [Maritimibacter fusiformis]
MQVKKLRFAAIALASALIVTPVTSLAESLSDALVSAYRTSGLLDQQRALLRVKDEDVAVAVAGLRPVINYALNAGWTATEIGGTVTTVTNASATLSASFTIYDFGRTDKRIELARENVMMTRDMLMGVEQQVLMRAVSAFLSVRSAHETALLQENNVRLITEELRAARDRFDVGEITMTDVSLAEARLAAAKSAEAAARGQLMVAREEYKAAIGHYPNGLQVPPRVPMTAKTLDEAKALARARHPDVLSAKRAVTVAELAVAISKTSMLPTVSADAGLTRSLSSAGPPTPSDSSRATVGVSITGPIYQGGKLSALYRQSMAQAEAAKAGLHIAVQGVEQAVANAWAQLAIAQASIEATDRQIRASRVALRGAREELALGARTTLEVLNFEQDLLDAQAARISAESDQYRAVYTLLSSMGLLTAEHLGLGIATYDPEAYYNAVQGAPVHLVSPQGERLDAVLEALGRK